MMFVNNIPLLKVYKQKSKLPMNVKAPTMYSMVFVNNGSINSIQPLIDSQLLSHNFKYLVFFNELSYNEKVGTRTYVKTLRKEQEALYDSLDKSIKYKLQYPTQFSQIRKRNFYYNMIDYNNIFYSLTSKLPYNKLPELYVKYIKGIIDDEKFADYKTKLMVIDLEDWTNSVRGKDSRTILSQPVSMIYYLIRKDFDTFASLGNIDIIIYDKVSMIRINPSQMNKKEADVFRREIAQMSKDITFLDTIDDQKQLNSIETEDKLATDVKNVLQSKFNFTGDEDSDGEIEKLVTDEVQKVSKENTESTEEEVEEVVDKNLMNDEEFLNKVRTVQNRTRIGTTTTLSKRDQEIREKQRAIQIKNTTLEELQKMVTTESKIHSIDVSEKVSTTNKNVTNVRFNNFEKAYNEHLFKKDFSNMFTNLNDKSIPVFVRDIQVEDTSDEMNLKETYTIDLEDANRVRHRVKVDMPLFINDKFLYLNGNKVVIIKQKTLKPICKTGPDEVQVVGNYNKIFVRRSGTKVSSELENLKKTLNKPTASINIDFGNVINANKDYVTTIELDDLAKHYKMIKTKEATLIFTIKDASKVVLEDKKIKVNVKDNQLLIGFTKDNQPILLNTDTQLIEGTEQTICQYVVSILPEKVQEEYKSLKGGKKFIYSKATMMSKQIPLLLVLASMEGLEKVLQKAEIKHYFTDKRVKVDHTQNIVQFADGYLVYDKYPMKNVLLLNAFADIPTRAFTMEDMEMKETYATIMSSMFGNANLINAIQTFYEFMIDPITKETLIDLGYPTDFVSVMLVANELLSDNNCPNENHMGNYRIRSNELVNAILHKKIADAYATYRDSAYNNNPKKISIPQDAVIKELRMLQNVEDYSTLNPIVELEKTRAITSKGFVGVNMDKAYNEEKRTYDDSMLGLMSVSTSPDANCGVVRQLTLEPTVAGPRGYVNVNYKDLDKLTDANLFSPAELLSPLGASRDDTTRTAMATKQSKHIIPIAKSSPVLLSNGVEQVVQYHLSDDFAVTAEDDGEVMEVNPKTGIIVIKYKNGKHKAIDTNPKVVKNGAGGFYLSNQLECNLTKGQKVKKNDILATDKHFFSNTMEGNKFNIGSLQKIAVFSTYSTFEDSAFITEKLSRDMSADIVMQKHVVIGKNSNIDKMVSIGQQIKVGDELIRIESSFQDDSMNELLKNVGDSLGEEIKSLGKTPIKSKYSGVIEDIKIYSTVELDQLSPSLRKITQDYYDRINEKKKQLSKYDKNDSVIKCGMILNEPTGKIETKDGKIKGNEVGEGILIEFYIKYNDKLGVGDKITYFTALKSIIGEVIPEGYEPFSEFRPDEEISTSLAPGSVLARMTPSILITMFGNKMLIELKRALEDIYNE